MERPTTPVRPTLAVPIIQSTPQARGTASHTSPHEQVTQAEYAPYIQEDLKHRHDLPLHTFLSEVFRTRFDEHQGVVEQVAKGRDLQRQLKRYCEPVPRGPLSETYRYKPFTELANAAMDALYTRINGLESKRLVFCRNDPVLITGSHAERKPDVVGVWQSAANDQTRLGVDSLSLEGPSDAPFAWHELLMYVEFKLVKSEIDFPQTAQTKVSGSHDTPAGKPTVARIPRLQGSGPKTANKLPPPPKRVTRSASKAPPPPNNDRASNNQPIVPAAATRAASTPVLGLEGNDALKSPASGQAHTPRTSVDLPTQCASYALEMMSHGGIRHHAFGASVIDENITFHWYGHSRILYSEPLNFVADFPRFLTVLLHLMSLKQDDWGFTTRILNPPSDIPNPNLNKRIPILSLYHGQSLQVGGQTYVLGDIISQQHDIIGRGTCVIGAKSNQGVEAAVKFSWPASGRMLEHELLEKAGKHIEPPDKDGKTMAHHLPKVLGHGEDERWMKLGIECKPRQLQIMVFSKLMPITQLTTVKDLAEAIRGIFQCYRWLYEKAQILHRDISLNNFMYRVHEGKVYGVLNDFDLSYLMTDQHPDPDKASSEQRTGTLPFMSIDLLREKPTVHGYRHDLESFMWVILFLIGQYQDGKSLGRSGPYYEWLLWDRAQLLQTKLDIRDYQVMPQAQPAFEPLLLWIEEMGSMFFEGNVEASRHAVSRNPNASRHPNASRNPRASRNPKASRSPNASTFDVKSSGGWITFEKFQEVLDIDVSCDPVDS